MPKEETGQKEEILEVIYIGDKSLFPISWFNKQGFCEYQIYLENVLRIEAKPTKEMAEGKEVHDRLYQEFKVTAVPATFEEALNRSKTGILRSRELRVQDTLHGIYGRIDEALLTPDKFVIIDDKPGTRAYDSNINQVYGYCLAFKELIGPLENRDIIAALRKRGTDNTFWKQPFDELAERKTVAIVRHIHALILGVEEFASSDNASKCRGCKLNKNCDRVLTS